MIYNVVETSFTKEGLLADTEYNFRVQTTRGNEMSEWSDTIKIKTRLDAPNNVISKSVTWDSVTLSWDTVENTTKEPIVYKVEIKKEGENERGFIEVYNGTETSFTKRGLFADTEYNFRVQTARGNEMSGWSDVIKMRTSKVPIPLNISMNDVTWDSITLSWDVVENKSKEPNKYKVEMKREGGGESAFIEVYNGTETSFTKRGLLTDTGYNFRIQTTRGDEMSEWSDDMKIKTKKWEDLCIWKECPDDVDEKRKYSDDDNNPRIATFIGDDWCTIIGNIYIPLINKVTSWNIKILKSKKNNGGGILIGVTPLDINQNDDDNSSKCGWYFYCHSSTLCSGPPHNFRRKEYGPRREKGEYVHEGDSVGVVMDTTKRELSFILDGNSLGVAYEGIPLDKPLVPCVLLGYEGDSVELDTSGVKENEMNSSIPVPSSITVKSITWDSITLTWNAVEGASFYQIEVGRSNSWDATTTNVFTKRGLLPETEHSFRVRIVEDIQ